MTTLELTNLSKSYPAASANAVNNLSLAIGAGELVALLGPSGCGKTTTLKMIAGLIAPSAGDIRFGGSSVLALAPERRNVAMVLQKPLLFPHMTIGENVGFGLKMRRTRPDVIRQRVAELLDLVRLPGLENRRPGQLSGGQEQRVALARALIVTPQVLLLDEPLSQLDANLRGEMRELIRRLQRQLGITTILVTHDQEEAVLLADRVALLFDGCLQQYDTPRGFYERPASAQVARFFGGVNFIAGEKQAHRFISPLGTFALNGTPAADGPALLTIRPEAIGLQRAGENQVHGIVRAALYLGTQMRYTIDVAGSELYALAASDSPYQPGETVTLSLPKERLWLVAAE